MRTGLVLPALLLVVLAACNAAGGPGSSADQSAPAASVPAGNGSVDCARIEAAARQLLAIQLLAQLNSPDTVEGIRAQTIGNLDLDAFLAAMHDLHALDSHASPLGDPKAAIDVYEKAGEAAQVLFATDPITQAAIDTYNENVGDVAAFLGHQIAISGAIDEAGC
jgi:hypothetical protein